jgi:hypothetical protein
LRAVAPADAADAGAADADLHSVESGRMIWQLLKPMSYEPGETVTIIRDQKTRERTGYFFPTPETISADTPARIVRRNSAAETSMGSEYYDVEVEDRNGNTHTITVSANDIG